MVRLRGGSVHGVLAKLGHPLGFFLVIIGRQQLFTENTLTVIIPLLERRDLTTLIKVLPLWATVLFANLAGVHAIACESAAVSFSPCCAASLPDG
jgi:formate-nitrite transporter family protein